MRLPMACLRRIRVIGPHDKEVEDIFLIPGNLYYNDPICKMAYNRSVTEKAAFRWLRYMGWGLGYLSEYPLYVWTAGRSGSPLSPQALIVFATFSRIFGYLGAISAYLWRISPLMSDYD